MTTTRCLCWFFQEAMNKAQIPLGHSCGGVNKGVESMSTVHLGREGTGCGCPVIKSAGHRPSPLHQQKSHQRGSIRMRPIRIIRSHSKALKTSYLSPPQLFWDSLCELPFPLPPMSQEPHKYWPHINTFNSYTTPSRKTIASIFYWWLSWAQRGKVIGHDHTVFSKVEIQTQIYLKS